MARRTTRIIGIDEHGCTTTPVYQLIDEGQKTTKRDNSKNIYFFELWIHRLVCRTKFNMFLPDKPCREVGLAESHNSMENSSRALLLSSFGSEELLPRMVHGNWKKDVP